MSCTHPPASRVGCRILVVKTMSYYFRVDANDNIGIGHMMRCLSIARAMRRRGQEATFFVADRNSAAMAAQNGFGYYCLNTDYDHLDVEADRFIQIIRDRDAANLLVDSYYVTENYLNKIREVTNLTYIDDINRFIYPCSLLINYNIYAESLDYERRYREAGLDTEFALGLSYMPLRDEYRDLQKKPHEGIRILITTGATDKFNVLGHILDTMMQRGLISGTETAGPAGRSSQENGLEVAAVVGQYNHHRDALFARFGGNPQIHLLDPQPTLADLISESDIAVTAGGTTVYELCAGGLASVMLTIADNQMRAAKAFAAKGLIPYAGDVRYDINGVAEKAVDQITEYINHPAGRQAAGEKMRSVVDGRGADRLAELLISRMQ